MGRLKGKSKKTKSKKSWICVCPVCGLEVTKNSFACTHCSPAQWVHNKCGGYTYSDIATLESTMLRCNNCKKSTETDTLTDANDQGTSAQAALTHVFLEEIENDITEQEATPKTFHLFVGKSQARKSVLEASLIPCEPGTLVHNKPLEAYQAKFQITEVLDTWPEYDEDYHMPGSYVVWERDQAEEKKEAQTETEKEKRGKAKKKKGGRAFRKNRDKIIEEEEEEEEMDEEEENSQQEDGGRQLRKRKIVMPPLESNSDSDEEEEIESDDVEDYEESEEESIKTRKKRNTKACSKNQESDNKKRKKSTKEVKMKDNSELGEKGGRKKAKERKTRKASKIMLGKKAADKTSRKSRDKIPEEEENLLDYEEEDDQSDDEEERTDTKTKKKKDEERKIWKEGNRRVDPRAGVLNYGPKLLDPSSELWNNESFLEYLFTFLPVRYIEEVMLPATNCKAKENGTKIFTFEELVRVLGILYMMEVVQLPERRMYWKTEQEGFFPGLSFGRSMSVNRFEEFLNLWQFSYSDESDQQVLDFIDAVNINLKGAMRAGAVLCVDESMLKSYHRGLNGKMKIKRKPRPIGNELKTVSDAASHVVLHMELHEAKEDMTEKDFVQEFGATTACTLRITEHWKGSGSIVIGDSWFGSVQTCVELYNVNGLHSIMLVKTAHRRYPRLLLRETHLERGEWTSAVGEIDGVKLMATRFVDLQEKMFISSCSTDLNGPPRRTKYHGFITRPQVAYDYLADSASIDIHNHFRTGSTALEDAWQTKSAHLRQIAGVLGFLFTNSFLAYRFFQKSSMKHSTFKMKLANIMMEFSSESRRPVRYSDRLITDVGAPVHCLVLMWWEKMVKRGLSSDFKSTASTANTILATHR